MKLSNLARVLRAAGLTVVETPGWATRGYTPPGGSPLDMAEIRGVLWHHTATGRAAYARSNAPTLNMTVNGRSDLAGPLCNITLGRDGTVYLVAAGLANHAGKGVAPGIPRNTGNYRLVGIEMESSGIAPWDWTADQLRVAPHLGAALERAYLQGLPADMRLQLGHKEYSSEGKIDPAGWPGDMAGLRASINAVLAGGTTTTAKDAFDMATPQEVIDGVFRKEWKRQGPGVSGTTNLGATVAWLDANLTGINQKLAASDAKVTALVGAVNAVAKGEKFDEAKLLASIEDAAERGVKAAIDSIETTVTLAAGAE